MFGENFYPTPSPLIYKMLAKVDLEKVGAILEPSAGRGDIVERVGEKFRYGYRKPDIDTIELDPELSAILAEKGYKPIASDFLTFETYRHYDLVLMNPPFSTGDKHLLKALQVLKGGGQVVCLLNAETLRNPHTNSRRVLVQKLNDYGASVEFIADGFTDAARTTSVETALIHVNIPYVQPTSDILANLIAARELAETEEREASELVEGNYLRGAVRRYEIEVEAGLKFLSEYDALKPLLSCSLKATDRPIIEVIIDGDKYGNAVNNFVRKLRMKYWQELFKSSEFGGLFTSNVREQYSKSIADLARYEFNMSNIKQMQVDISHSMIGTLDAQIVALFDEFSSQYYDEQSNNIHYYNGWKTNKAYIVNKKVITHLYLYSYGSLDKWKLRDKMTDVHKVFAYLDGTLSTDLSAVDAALEAVDQGQTRKIVLPYCTIDFFKKGTCHITFNDERLLKKFNLIGSQRKGWLPPNYGKAAYADMTNEQRRVVDAFEGEESYNETMEHQDFYELRAPLMLGAGPADAGLAA